MHSGNQRNGERGRGTDMRAVVTVKGEDGVGIIARVSKLMADYDVNIVDIAQTTAENNFFMIMLVDTSKSEKEFSKLSQELRELGKELKQNINVSNEKLFNSMHRI